MDFKLRNEGSYLGNLWYLLNPLLLFIILYAVFFERLGAGIQYYPAYLIVGILMFNFFMRTTLDATGAILGNGFIKSLSFQKEALVLSIVLKHLFAHVFEIFVFFIVLVVFFDISILSVPIYILIALLLSAFTYGVSLVLAALTVHFVDLKNVWQFFVTLLWFGTPIFYQLEAGSTLYALNMFNPLHAFITATRDLAIYEVTPGTFTFVGIVIFPLISILIGTVTFTKLQARFAELV